MQLRPAALSDALRWSPAVAGRRKKPLVDGEPVYNGEQPNHLEGGLQAGPLRFTRGDVPGVSPAIHGADLGIENPRQFASSEDADQLTSQIGGIEVFHVFHT